MAKTTKKSKKAGDSPVPVFPKTKTEQLADLVYEHLVSYRNTDSYCVVDRSMGTHFFEVLKDAILGYKFDHYVCERLYPTSKCQLVKYPVYEASDEAMIVYNEFVDFSNQELSKEELKSEEFIENRAKKLQDYIDFLNTIPPKQSEKDQLAYVSGYNGDLGYPVVKLADIPEEILKNLSYKLAENAISHFTTMNFVNQDAFIFATEIVVADTEYTDILVQLRYGVG